MKRYFYISCFVILGLILQQMIHTAAEMIMIKLLIKDFDAYGLGLSWNTWFTIHHVAGFVLLIAGVLWGYWQGVKWWDYLYDANGKVKYPRPWRI